MPDQPPRIVWDGHVDPSPPPPATRRFGIAAGEDGVPLSAVTRLPWTAKIYCDHAGVLPRKSPKHVATVLRDGRLIADGTTPVSVTSATGQVHLSCKICVRRAGIWLLDPVRLRDRLAEGGDLTFVRIEEVADRKPL